MSGTKGGGPAFPFKLEHEFDATSGVPIRTEVFTGMLLRDFFAGKVIAGFCANPAIFAGNDRNGWDLVNCTEPQLAQVAYRIADAMIAAREVQS